MIIYMYLRKSSTNINPYYVYNSLCPSVRRELNRKNHFRYKIIVFIVRTAVFLQFFLSTCRRFNTQICVVFGFDVESMTTLT